MIISKRELQQWKGIPICKVKERLEIEDEFGDTLDVTEVTYRFMIFGKNYSCNSLEEAHKTITSIL